MWDNEGVAVEDVPACPLCGAEGPVLYAGLRDRYWDAPGTWSLRRCPACRHLWLDPRPRPADIHKLYTAYYTHAAPEGPPPTPLGARARRATLARLGYAPLQGGDARFARLLGLLPLLRESIEREFRSVRGPPRGRLLDVGCGDGAFLRSMRDLGWDVAGLETDPRAAAVARGRGLEVIERPIEPESVPEDAFDAVTTSHVIEHVIDPVRALEACRRALRPGGFLAVVTPNADGWGHRRFRDAWFHLDPPRHLHLFTAANLRACATRAGLQVSVLRTSATGAAVARHASRAVRARGRFRFPDGRIVPDPGDRAFGWAEWAATRVSADAGEEFLLFATKEGPA